MEEKKKTFTCKECPYYWDDLEYECLKDGIEWDEKYARPTCHYQWNDGYAPCEVFDREVRKDA